VFLLLGRCWWAVTVDNVAIVALAMELVVVGTLNFNAVVIRVLL
jgi:hypothetical protein